MKLIFSLAALAGLAMADGHADGHDYELTACHQEVLDVQNRHPGRTLEELNQDRFVFVPVCREDNGEYAEIQQRLRRKWCVDDVTQSSAAVLHTTRFWRTNPKFDQPGFCDRLKWHRCYGKDTRYCNNKMCEFMDKNSKFMECGNECLVEACHEQQNTYNGLGPTFGPNGRGPCPQHCERGCFCKDGFIFDQQLGLCVRPQFCEVGCNYGKIREVRKTPEKEDRYNIRAMRYENRIQEFTPTG